MAGEKKGQYIPAIRPIEPADERVAEILQDRQQHFDELRLSPSERNRLLETRKKVETRKKKQKAKSAEMEKYRITTYLPTDLIAAIEAIARKEGVSMSQVISFFLFEAVDHFERQEIAFWGHKYPSDSPRYEWNLVHPKDNERLEKVQSRKTEQTGWGA
jgi:hypothetical protein